MSDYSDNSAAIEVTSKVMISAVIVFFLVILIVFLLHLYARFMWTATPEDPEIVAWRRQLAGQNRPSDVAGSRQQRQKGLKASALKALPIAVYNPKEFKEGLECSICLSELQEDEKVRILPNCSHGFHLDCIDKWFHSHSTCPICRAPVLEPVLDLNSAQEEEETDASESGNSAETRSFPINVLFWGDETQVRMSQEPASTEEVGSSGNSSEGLVIDIPMAEESCSNVSKEEEKSPLSPVMTRMKSLRRLLSRGKKVSPSPCSSSSMAYGDEQV